MPPDPLEAPTLGAQVIHQLILRSKEVEHSLNFIRLLRVVITPSVTVVERRKRLEAIR